MEKKWDDDLTKLSLSSNAAIQDITASIDEATQSSLSALVDTARGHLQTFRDRCEDLERVAKIADKDTDKIQLESICKKHRGELGRLHAGLRKANLMCLSAIEKREKEALFGGDASTGVRQRSIKDKKAAAKTNSAITDSLIKVSQMMSDQLTKSGDTITTLTDSSSAISSVGDELKGMSGHLKNARTLLTKYARREMTDKLFIFLSLVFFFATVLYIWKKRYWYSAVPMDNSNVLPEHSHDTIQV